MEDVLQRARRRGRQADALIAELDLLRRWSDVGRPEIVGALSYGL